MDAVGQVRSGQTPNVRAWAGQSRRWWPSSHPRAEKGAAASRAQGATWGAPTARLAATQSADTEGGGGISIHAKYAMYDAVCNHRPTSARRSRRDMTCSRSSFFIHETPARSLLVSRVESLGGRRTGGIGKSPKRDYKASAKDPLGLGILGGLGIQLVERVLKALHQVVVFGAPREKGR